tara:strand:- start:15 stop:278 length:264 start_codon:yes stop_codon:yes gene_type:complete
MLWTNLLVGTIGTLDILIGDHLIHLMFIGIDTTFGTIGHLIIHLIMDGVGIDGIDGTLDGGIGIIGIDLFIIGIIGITGLGVILDIM